MATLSPSASVLFLAGSQAMVTLFSTKPSASVLPILQPKPFTSNSIKCCENQRVTVDLTNNGLATFPEKNAKSSLAAATVQLRPPRPRRIILVRHGQSEGNLDESMYTRVADPKIALTQKGMAEAEECGKRIRELIEQDKVANWQVYFYVSPYRRTLETLKSLASVFERSRIAGMREEPRLREQDFGRCLTMFSSFALELTKVSDMYYQFNHNSPFNCSCLDSKRKKLSFNWASFTIFHDREFSG